MMEIKKQLIEKRTMGELTGLSDSTLRRMELKSQFPKRRQISPSRVAYLHDEYVSWEQGCPVAGEVAS